MDQSGAQSPLGLTQGHEGSHVQNPRSGQVMQLQAVELQQRVEKLVWWHTESSLVEHRARHDVSLHRSRRCRILEHTTGSQLHRYHIPLTHKVLQVLLHDQ
jgi:hypothetical protein